MDLSYLAVSDAVAQLERLEFDEHADLVALVKPTFELHRGTLAASDADLRAAVDRDARGVVESHWRVVGSCDAPATGQRGAREAFVHATRSQW